MECFSANYIWLIRDLAHCESSKRMQVQKSAWWSIAWKYCASAQVLDVGMGVTSLRHNLLSWMLSDSDKVINFNYAPLNK